jgi:hypothetical protein
MNRLIGISGLAGDGKDSVCNILKKYFEKNTDFKFYQIALADELKQDCRKACLDMFGIDPVNCSREEKNKIRDFLVFYAKVMRSKTGGSHWATQAEKKIKNIEPGNNIICISDIRYGQYQKDEVQWLKSKKQATLIHVKKYKIIPVDNSSGGIELIKSYSTPINQEEGIHCPVVEKMADIILEWPDVYPEKPEQNKNCVNVVNHIAKDLCASYH